MPTSVSEEDVVSIFSKMGKPSKKRAGSKQHAKLKIEAIYPR
jgi:hypothetical protein